MKIKKNTSAITINELKSALEKRFIDFKIRLQSKNSIIISRSNTIGAIITINKKYILVECEFPAWYSKLIYYLSILVLGIIIHLIIYYAVFYKKFRTIEKEIGNFIKLQCSSIDD
jgi:hypothetical protein